jgi:hypothetical protein
MRPRDSASRAAILGLVFVASYAYFYEGGGWNQNTRFDLVRAVVERHTVQIDVYQDNTGDKAQVGEHYYADKAPGASLAAVPAVAIARFGLKLLGVDVFAPAAIGALSYVATVAGASMPAALAGVCVFWLSRRLGASDVAAGVAAVTCSLGTPLFAYATILYGHALAAGCLTAALLGAAGLSSAQPGSHELRRVWLTGFAAGWAVVTEFPASIPAAAIVACAFYRLSGGRINGIRMRSVAMLLFGLAVPAAVLLIYNYLAFGAFFHIGYTSEAGYEAMRTGIFGVGWPKLEVARELLFGSYRGLLPLAPVLIAVPVGFWLLIRKQVQLDIVLLALGVAAYYFVLTAGYAYWDGGWSYGSRHLGPALPFLAIAIAPVWDRAGRVGRFALSVLLVVSVGESLVAVATTAQPPGISPTHPMRELLWPAFVSGDFPIGWQSVLELRPPSGPLSELERLGVPRASWNLGQKLGLHGHASLLPLMAIWIAAIGAWKILRKSEVEHLKE